MTHKKDIELYHNHSHISQPSDRCSGHLTSSRRTRATSSAAHQNGHSAASMAACASAVQSACVSPCASSSLTKRSQVSVRRTPWVAKGGGFGELGKAPERHGRSSLAKGAAPSKRERGLPER